MMADSIKIGNMNIPKPALVIGVAAAGGILFYAYYSRTSGGGEDTGDETATDDGIDPYTGLPYTDEFGFGGGFSGIGITDPGTGSIFGPGYGGQIVTGVTTNAAWSQAVIAYFEGHGTYPEVNISSALGKVLTGQALTVDELNIFNAARAVQGEPPQPYPPIHMVSAAPPGTTNPPPSNSRPGKVGGLRVLSATRNSIRMGWTAVSGASHYFVYSAGGSGRQFIGQTTSTSFTRGGLKSGTRHSFWVEARGNGIGPLSNKLTASTKR